MARVVTEVFEGIIVTHRQPANQIFDVDGHEPEQDAPTTLVAPENEGNEILTTEFDVVVIGAGIAGVSAARTLSKAGLSVIMLEARALGISGW